MEFRNLGRSGLKISEIVFGNAFHPHDNTPDEVILSCVRAALDSGVTTFDTADIYGFLRAEELLGRALAGEPREKMVISTKVFFPVGAGPNGRGLSRKHIMEGIDGSLRRLRTDYVDIYTAHRFDPETPLEETMCAFADLVRAGKVLYLGVSEWPAEQIRAAAGLAAELRVPLVFNMSQYSILWREIEQEIIPVCAELGLGQVPYFTLAQGVLTGKYEPGRPPPAGSRGADPKGGRAAYLNRLLDDDVLRRVQRLRPLAADAGLTMAQLATAWVLQNPDVAGAAVGASRPGQVTEVVKAAGVKLDPELMARIDEIVGPVVVHAQV